MSEIREDLNFLYKKAMRSKDWEFMCEVFWMLVESEMDDQADKLTTRMLDFFRNSMNIEREEFHKMDFLLKDSQLGSNWYQNRR